MALLLASFETIFVGGAKLHHNQTLKCNVADETGEVLKIDYCNDWE